MLLVKEAGSAVGVAIVLDAFTDEAKPWPSNVFNALGLPLIIFVGLDATEHVLAEPDGEEARVGVTVRSAASCDLEVCPDLD